MKRTIRLKQCYPYKPEQVWLALTDAGLLGNWFMENDFKPVINHEFTFRMAPQKGWDGITHCKVMEVEPVRRLTYTYRGKAGGEKTLACAGIHSDAADKAVKGIFAELNTVLSFTLTPTCGGTCLELKHTGFKGFKLVVVSLVMQMGWKKQLRKKLPRVLEKIARLESEGQAFRKS